MPEEQQQQQQETPEQIAAREQAEELERLRALAKKFQPLEGIATALEEDPSRIYALQDALSGRPQHIQQPAQQQQQQVQLTPEQIQRLNVEALSRPAEFMAAVADQAARNRLAEFQSSAGQFVNTTGELFIDSFKNRKAMEDPLYKQILPLFDGELRDIDRQAIVQQDAGGRARALELRWQAAAAKVFRQAAAQKNSGTPTPLGSSSGGTPSAPPAKKTAITKDPFITQVAQNLIDQGLLSEDDVNQINKEMEDSDE